MPAAPLDGSAPDSSAPGGATPDGTAPRGAAAGGTAPLRVSTLELFFDLVFAFTLTQLTVLLTAHLSAAGIAQVLLVFGVLWWMYGGYAWLTNTRTPDSTAERLLLLLGMAGFLVAGLAIPHGFGPSAAVPRSRSAWATCWWCWCMRPSSSRTSPCCWGWW